MRDDLTPDSDSPDAADEIGAGTATGLDGTAVAAIVAATALVVGVRATGSYVNHDPILDFDLTIELPGEPPISMSHKELVPQRLLSRVQLGGTLPVLVSTRHTHDLSIDWTATD